VAETILVRTALTPEMIAAGRELLARLDALDPAFEAAFWLFDEKSANGGWCWPAARFGTADPVFSTGK